MLLARPKLSARTVEREYLRSIKSVFSFAVRDERLKENPASGVFVQQARRERGKSMRGYSDEETRTILRATLEPPKKKVGPKLRAALYWVIWILAYTGARVNEITSLRRGDFAKEDGYWRMRIDFMDTKTLTTRKVPVHEHLIEMGLLDYVSGLGPDEALFHNRPRDVERQSAPGAEAAGRICAWVRSLGIGDPETAPNHAWRHRFKTEGRRFVAEVMLDAIQGHLDTRQGLKYGDFPPRVTGPQMAKLPRISLEGRSRQAIIWRHALGRVGGCCRECSDPASGTQGA